MLKFLKTALQCTGLMTGTLFFMSAVHAQDVFSATSKLDDLSQTKAWQHLIFVQRGWAEITSENFYLSEEKSAPAELLATLQEFERNPQAKCTFPARYYWLSTQLNDAFLQQGLSDCEKLAQPIKQLSLLLVGGYMKNPASTFGHMLINVQTTDKHRLLADTYNYGGDIPVDESAIHYVLKGVSGLYDGAFNKDAFSRSDDIYTQRENRDIWEYTLDLSEHEKLLLTYHLDELTRFKFNYYFFKQNCAYRTAELFEFIDALEITQRKTPWYFPEYIASQIVEFDLDPKQQRKLIQEEVFRPSNQTANYEYFKSLPKDLRQTINHILKTKQLNTLDDLPPQQREQAFYFLLNHTENRHKINPDLTEDAALRKALVRKRITLPVLEDDLLPEFEVQKTSSVHGPKPSKLGVLLGTESGVSFSIYQRDALNETVDLTSEFKVLDGKYVHRDGQDILNLNFVEMSKFANLEYALQGMRNWSWSLKTGVEENPFALGQRQFYGQAAAGGAYSLSPTWLGYQLLALSLHDQDRHVDFKSITGLLVKNEQWSGQFAYEYMVRDGKNADTIKLTARKKLAKNMDTRLNMSKQTQLDPQASLGVNFYW